MCIRDSNPTTGTIYLKDSDYLPNTFLVVVKDYLGKNVVQQRVIRSAIMPIRMDQLNTGLFVLNIYTDYGVVNKKILLVK